MSTAFRADQRWLAQSPDVSDRSSFSSRRSPMTPTTTPASMASPVEPSSLDAFLAEVDEWLVRTNQRITELENRHRKHLSVEVEGVGSGVTGEWSVGAVDKETGSKKDPL